MNPEPRIVLAGSRKLPPGHGPRLVVSFLAALPFNATVLLRHGTFTKPNEFERTVAELCEHLGIRVEWCVPTLSLTHKGRKAVWYRDMDMLASADLCLCFYDIEQIGDEESGTVALVDKAMSLNVPVYAYAILDDGEVARVGEHDAKNEWAQLVPAT